MSKKYTEKDLASILSEVEVGFKKHLEAETTLTKSETSNSQGENDVEYNDEDKAELNKMYSSMTKSEAEIHFNALKSTFNIEDMTKSEQESSESKMLKSENEGLKSENEDLKKSLETVLSSLKKMVIGGSNGPQRKAITELSVIAKSEESTKDEKDFSKITSSEIASTLSSKVRGGELKKSDNEAIVNYYQSKDIELIKHLL